MIDHEQLEEANERMKDWGDRFKKAADEMVEACEKASAALQEFFNASEQLGIDPSQAWYWTPEWQAREREADEDIKAGRFE